MRVPTLRQIKISIILINVMKKNTKLLLQKIIDLPEYERKQIISVLIASMLNSESQEEAKKTYDNIINQLSK